MKKILLILIMCLVCCSGCASIMARGYESAYGGTNSQPYIGVKADFMFLPFSIIDIPGSFLVDTLKLPDDLNAKWEKEKNSENLEKLNYIKKGINTTQVEGNLD